MTTDHTPEPIDYTALARAAYGRDPIPTEWDVDVAWDATTDAIRQSAIEGVRAVVAAYQQQMRERGVVEVRRDDLSRLIDRLNKVDDWGKWSDDLVQAYERIASAEENSNA